MNANTFRTKSFWSGLAMIVTGIGMICLHQPLEGLQTIAGGIATIFVRDAISKMTAPPADSTKSN